MSMLQMGSLTVLLIVVFLVIRLGLHKKLRKGLPDFLHGLGVGLRRLSVGLTDQRIPAADHDIAFLAGGKESADAVVLLHDFGGEKDDWLRIAGKLRRKGLRVVIPDIAGFGESPPSPNSHYDVVSQVRRLRAFNQKIGVNKLHLMGCYMGGAIAGIYASLFAKDVLTLAMIEPFGIESPKKTEIEGLTERGWSPLTVRHANDFERVWKTLFVKTPRISRWRRRHLLDQAIEHQEAHERIWKEMWKNRPYLLESVLPEIKARTLIITGDAYKVVHPASMKIVEKGISGANTVVMKGCGHWPMVERPKELLDHYMKFLKVGGG